MKKKPKPTDSEQNMINQLGDRLNDLETEQINNEEMELQLDLYQEIESLLTEDADESSLRQNLETLSQKKKTGIGKNRFNPIAIAVCGTLAFLVCAYFIANISTGRQNEQQLYSSIIQGKNVSYESVLIEDKTESAFEPNGSLEFLMNQKKQKANALTLEVTKKQKAITNFEKRQAINFEIEGHLIKDENTANQELKVHIFSNKKSDYIEFLPMLSERLIFNDSEQLEFKTNQKLNLMPGLYYYLIESSTTETVLYVNSFTVM